MGKIINIDFKNKRLEYTWDDLARQRQIKQIELDLASLLTDIAKLVDDKNYVSNLAHHFATVLVRLKND